MSKEADNLERARAAAGDAESEPDSEAVDEPETDEPEAAKDEPETDEPETTDAPETATDEPETDEPETDEPETTDAPETAKERPKSKAERLEARAARLRAAEALRTERTRAGAGPAPNRTPWIVAVSVLGVLVVLLGVLVGIGVPYALHQRDLNSARSGAYKAAKAYAVDFGSYDYRHLDADLAKVASELTPSFAASYKKSSAGLKPTIVQYKGKSVATVQGEAITSVKTSSATVLIFLDQTITSSQSKTPRVDRNRLQMKLVHRDGKWLISNLLLK